jgi:hypothetical protein
MLDEGDADRMFRELVRVRRSGGRIAVIVRAIDMPASINLPLNPALRRCKSFGLRRFKPLSRVRAAGPANVHFFPQLTTLPIEPRLARLQTQALQALDAEAAGEFRRALAQAEAAGIWFSALPQSLRRRHQAVILPTRAG